MTVNEIGIISLKIVSQNAHLTSSRVNSITLTHRPVNMHRPKLTEGGERVAINVIILYTRHQYPNYCVTEASLQAKEICSDRKY